MGKFRIICFLLITLLFPTHVYCQDTSQKSLFELMSAEQTGVNFTNIVEEGVGSNILESEFFFNGGGISVGDINKDGLPDLYFTSNRGENALYLNKGNFQFENITREAGVSDSTGWTAGTSIADINGDGLLDIYICKSGKESKEERKNKLFINEGGAKFTEKASEYGLDDSGYGTQAAFFDYDKDGDLDVFITNYSIKRLFTGFNLKTIRNEYEPNSADRLYKKNDDGVFTDVSKEAGLIQNPLGFGLSGTVSDLKKNGWPDIYVANDFVERDYMYLNQGNGTFSEENLARTQVTSYYSMGSDIADINNDGFSDILVVDMLPYDYSRRRVFNRPDYNKIDRMASVYHRKNMRNVLQINNGNGTFTEIGQLLGISKTDWSWAPLIADFDNDGMKDIFITNGFPRFYTDLDFLNNVLWKDKPNDPKLRYNLVKKMQKVELHNFAFKNNGDLSFHNVSDSWGLSQYSVSNGAAYADLDNNGTLDLIVNNINQPAFILKNNALEKNGNNYLKVRLHGGPKNTYGIGAKVTVTGNDGTTFYQENFPVRGFQSSVDPVLLFGLGSKKQVNVEVIWPDQKKQSVAEITANQTLTFRKKNATAQQSSKKKSNNQSFQFSLLNEVALGLEFEHLNSNQGSNKNLLLPHSLSNLGPALAEGDINGDGLEDLFIGGGKGQSAALYVQQNDGKFARVPIEAFEQHAAYQDIDAEFFDATGNGQYDLYVVSGGNHDPTNGPLYQDRLYINDGAGGFIYVSDALPRMEASGGTVSVIEIDQDGDKDLFVGGRVISNKYPSPPRSYILENKKGIFTDVTEQISAKLLNPGMVTDSEWGDINNDGQPDLVITGEWMPIRVFENTGIKKFTETTDEVGLEKTSGWWRAVEMADLNNDGYNDLVAGNQGLNFSLRSSIEKPVVMYAGDFNSDGIIDPILTQIINNKRYPVPSRDRFLQQLPEFKNKFPTYSSYSKATIDDILNGQVDNAKQYELHTFESTLFKNSKSGIFQAIPLPREAQLAPIYDLVISDFDSDGALDIMAGGNNYGRAPENGPIAAQGVVLKGDASFNFVPYRSKQTGFIGMGEVRSLALLETLIGPIIVTARNGESVLLFLNSKAN